MAHRRFGWASSPAADPAFDTFLPQDVVQNQESTVRLVDAFLNGAPGREVNVLQEGYVGAPGRDPEDNTRSWRLLRLNVRDQDHADEVPQPMKPTRVLPSPVRPGLAQVQHHPLLTRLHMLGASLD